MLDLPIDSPGFNIQNPDGSLTFQILALRSNLPNTYGSTSSLKDNFVYVSGIDKNGKVIHYATGDVAKTRLDTASNIDSFILTRGLNTADFTAEGADSFSLPTSVSSRPRALFRAFLPTSSLPPGSSVSSLFATPLLVANPTASSGNPSRLFQADFILAENGRVSSISLTTGLITYDRTATVLQDDVLAYERALVTVDGDTVGSTRVTNATSLYSSPLVNTAAGGGRTWTGAPTGDAIRSGLAGYLLLENVSNVPNGPTGGVQQTLGTQDATAENYGVLRLATGIETRVDTDVLSDGGPASATFEGFVAGVLDKERPTSNVIDLVPYTGRLTSLALNAAANSVSATLTFDNGGPGAPLLLGDAAGSNGSSAYIEPGKYGASVRDSAGANAAIVAGEALKAASSETSAIKAYAHLQWGFLFGDLAKSSDVSTHAALSTWVAGTPCTPNQNCGVAGSAKYSGHAIGTVTEQAGSGASAQTFVATRVGTFTQTWDLSSRRGSMEMNFDRRVFLVDSLTANAQLAYGGDSRVTGDNYQARVSGQLVSVGVASDNRTVPRATIGQFQIRGAATDPYQANGTFGGEYTGP
jgi:hypothetical protein